MIQRIKHSLVGIPDDQAVSNVGGRAGAALGPKHFRAVWSRFQWSEHERKFFDDRGDLVCDRAESLESFHNRISSSLSEIYKEQNRVILIGGGHDFGAPFVAGYHIAFPHQRIGCINIDAHFDLRPKKDGKITSGSPFRILIDENVLDPERLIEFGIQKQSNHPDLFDFAKRNRIKTVLLSELISSDSFQCFVSEYQELEKNCDAILISLDLDVFPQSAAPGVSAPQAEGLAVSEVLKILAWSAKKEKTKGLGLFELNPIVDVQECTARLAATAAYRFISAANESE